MDVNTDPKKIEELLTRGVEEVIHLDNLRKKLESGKQLRIKLGIDPTSPNIHIGRSIPLLKLRDFQELGHQIVFIVGDFTSVIGDTSDKDSERPMLSKDVVDENKKNYYAQVAKVLDIEKVEFHHNSEWLEPLTYREIGEHADLFSVADFIARDNIKRRLDTGKRVSLREVLYPLMQGYDSVAIKADVEIGGTDQRFNLLAGRTMQPHFGQEPQDILMNPLINGTDGRKMSSSWGNTINLLEEPADMYGKVMSMQDSEIIPYFTICTRVPLVEVSALASELNAGGNPRDAKMRLAYEIVSLYHGAQEAERAQEVFVETFQRKSVPENIPEVVLVGGIRETLVTSGVLKSNSEFTRLATDGAITDMESGEKITDPMATPINKPLRIGKHRFIKIIK